MNNVIEIFGILSFFAACDNRPNKSKEAKKLKDFIVYIIHLFRFLFPIN